MGPVGAALVLLAPFVASSKPDPQPPAFEVASVKPSRLTPGGPNVVATRSNPGGINYTNVTLKIAIQQAYQVRDYQVIGPSWIESESYTYNIVAKAPAGAPKEQFPAMLRTLLAERFKMVCHRETREQAAYALVAAKNPPKLRKSEAAAEGRRGPAGGVAVMPTPAGMHIAANRVTMASLAQMLSSIIGRPVADSTQLEGSYDIVLDFSMEGLAGMRSMAALAGTPREHAPAPDSTPAPSIFTAIQQLGLKLETRRVPVEFIVVDSAGKVPTEN